MTLETCKTSLRNYVLTQSKGVYVPLSKLTTNAWGTDKQACLDDFGGLANVKSYVESIDLNQKADLPDGEGSDASAIAQQEIVSKPVVNKSFRSYILEQINGDSTNQVKNNNSSNTNTTSPNATSTSSVGGVKTTSGLVTSTAKTQERYSMNNLKLYALDGLYIAIGLFILYIIAHFMRKTLQLIYDYFNASRVVYLKVVQPRGDSKMDRDKERELSKDMKEKIGRMSQVFRSMHRLGQLGVADTISNAIFAKAKFTVNLHYEKGSVYFIIATYPEYQEIIESAISAQYSESSIETIEKPNYFPGKYMDIVPLEPKKDPVFPIKTFKQIEDDPINNVVDSMGELGESDSFDIIIHCRPIGSAFNKRAQRWAEGLYRNDKNFVEPESIAKRIFALPLGIFNFVIFGKKKAVPGNEGKYQEGGKDFVRMTKAKEDALNVMGEEAGRHAFACNLYLISTSAEAEKPKSNIRNMAGIFNIFKDEFNNELDIHEWKVDLLGFLLKPIWKFLANIGSISFFHITNTFTENQLTTLFHFPDGAFNRSPAIKWMDYKVLSSPDNLFRPKVPTDYVITGSITEGYLGGKVDKLFAKDHRAYGETVDKIENLIPFDPSKHAKVDQAMIVTNDEGKFVKEVIEKKRKGLRVYKDASLLGVNVYRNEFTPVYIKRKDRSRHHYIIGKSGGGKSVLLGFLARQDAWNGDGFCVIDPHGDLVEDILAFVPASRAKDVIYFDAGNETRPIGLNLYNINDVSEADRVVNDATDMFLKMFGPEVFGPRLQEYFKFGSLTLLEDFEEGATLLDVPRLFTDEAFREYKVSKVKNPVVRNFRERTYASIGDREKEEIIPYLTAKFVSFTTNSLIRNIIGQTKSVFNFRKIMDEGKILLVNLSKGKIGDLNTQLLGMIIVSQISNGAMSRANIPEDQRRDFYLYVDEFQNFVTNTFADILSEARKYHLSLIMAHQYIAQLDGGASNNIGETSGGKKSVKDAVFGNVGTIQSFKIGAPDAEFLEKEYAPVLSGQDIIGISNFKTYTKLNIDNATSRVFSLDTIWSQDYENKKVRDVLKQYSALKYGRDRKYVEAEIGARIGISMEDGSADTTDAISEESATEGVITDQTPIIQPTTDESSDNELDTGDESSSVADQSTEQNSGDNMVSEETVTDEAEPDVSDEELVTSEEESTDEVASENTVIADQQTASETVAISEPINDQAISQDQQVVGQANNGDQIIPQVEDKKNGTAI